MSVSDDSSAKLPVPQEGGAEIDAKVDPETGEAYMIGKDGKRRPLTPAEQMALYEKSLKEDDWGHQPC